MPRHSRRFRIHPLRSRALCTLALLVATLFPATRALAEDGIVIPAIQYQGLLENQLGRLNEPADFVFTLWDARSGGAQIGKPIVLEQVAVVDGVFSVELPFAVADFEKGEPRWLQVSIRGSTGPGGFETLAPRTAMGATPFAIRSFSGKPTSPDIDEIFDALCARFREAGDELAACRLGASSPQAR